MRARLLLWLLRAAARATRLVSRTSAEPLCRAAGTLWYLAAPRSRAAVRSNLHHVLGREPSARSVREVFQHGMLNYWDTLAIPQFSAAEVLALVDAEGWEHLDAALAEGRGAILAGAHLSSVALAGQAVAARGYPMVGVVEPLDPPELLAFFTSLRGAQGVRLLPASPQAMRALLLALRRNEVLGLVTDRDVLGRGLSVEFFGRATTFASGAAALAVRTGAPILPAVAVRVERGRFRAWIEPPLPVPRTGDPREDERQLTQAVARHLEYHISKHPEQWTVFQRRWPPACRPVLER